MSDAHHFISGGVNTKRIFFATYHSIHTKYINNGSVPSFGFLLWVFHSLNVRSRTRWPHLTYYIDTSSHWTKKLESPNWYMVKGEQSLRNWSLPNIFNLQLHSEAINAICLCIFAVWCCCCCCCNTFVWSGLVTPFACYIRLRNIATNTSFFSTLPFYSHARDSISKKKCVWNPMINR